MGKKDKHKIGQSRNNPVFKIANGKLSKQRGKPKEVTMKLKKVGSYYLHKNGMKIAKLDFFPQYCNYFA